MFVDFLPGSGRCAADASACLRAGKSVLVAQHRLRDDTRRERRQARGREGEKARRRETIEQDTRGVRLEARGRNVRWQEAIGLDKRREEARGRKVIWQEVYLSPHPTARGECRPPSKPSKTSPPLANYECDAFVSAICGRACLVRHAMMVTHRDSSGCWPAVRLTRCSRRFQLPGRRIGCVEQRPAGGEAAKRGLKREKGYQGRQSPPASGASCGGSDVPSLPTNRTPVWCRVSHMVAALECICGLVGHLFA
jgi:hypothetical protein